MFQRKVMPFGLQTAPAKCKLRVDQISYPIRSFCITYIDYILIFSKFGKEHISHLTAFCELIEKHGLDLSYRKIELFKASIGFLGMIINNGTIEPQSHV